MTHKRRTLRILLEDGDKFKKSMDSLAQAYSDVDSLKADFKDWMYKTYGEEYAKQQLNPVANELNLTSIANTAKNVSRISKDPSKESLFDSQSGEAILDPSKIKTTDSASGESNQATVQSVDDDLAELEDNMEEFEQTLEASIEKAYKAEDTAEYAELEKNMELFKKYSEFIAKLFNKIKEFARSKERQDVIDATEENIAIFMEWGQERMSLYDGKEEELFGKDFDGDNPPPKVLKSMVKIFDDLNKDLKKIALTIKKDPLKKMNKQNILESVRKERREFLMEQRIRRKIRNLITQRR